MATLIELQNDFEGLQAKAKAAWDALPDKKMADGQTAKDMSANDILAFNQMQDELAQKGSGLDKLRKLEQSLMGYADEDGVPANRKKGKTNMVKTLGQMFSETYSKKSHGPIVSMDFEMPDIFGEKGYAADDYEYKANMLTSAGYAPFVTRDAGVTPMISRPPQLLDYLRVIPTSQNSVKYMKQSTRTNSTTGLTEVEDLPESALAYTETTADIVRIGEFLPVSEIQLEDVNEIRAIIDNDLRLMVRQELDRQVTVGDGLSQCLTGWTSLSSKLTEVKASGDTTFDTILKAMNSVRTDGRAMPNLAVLHGDDLTNLALTKDADGRYIYGDPTAAPLSRVWGIAIVASEALTAGTAIVADSMFTDLRLRKDVTIETTNAHSTWFIKNLNAIRAVLRAGLVVKRDESVCVLTI